MRGAFGNPAVSVSPADKAIERGSAAATKEDWDSAITEFTEAVRVDPKRAEGYCGLGMAYGEKHDWDKAIANLSEAIRLNPKYAQAYSRRGCAYLGKGCPNSVFKKNGTNVTGLIGAAAWGFLGLGKAEFDRAIADFTEVIRLKPDCVKPTTAVAWPTAWRAKRIRRTPTALKPERSGTSHEPQENVRRCESGSAGAGADGAAPERMSAGAVDQDLVLWGLVVIAVVFVGYLVFTFRKGVDWRNLVPTLRKTGVTLVVKLAAVGILVGSFGQQGFGYYNLLRFVVCGAAAYAAFLASTIDKAGWVVTFAVVALLFNPIIPVRLDRGIWTLVDLVVILLFLVSVVAVDRHLPRE